MQLGLKFVAGIHTGSRARPSRVQKLLRSAAIVAILAATISTSGIYAHAQTAGANAAAAQKSAKTVTIHLDPDATTVRFTLKSLLHNVHGTFKLKGGDVVTNPATGLAQGEVLIDAESASTGDAGRDNKWRREILGSTTYPAIIFHPTKIEGIKAGGGSQQVKASGTLTVKGQDHPVEMTLKMTTDGMNVTLSTHFVVPYVQWGLQQASAGIVRYDKQLLLDVDAKGVLKNETAVPSAPPAADSQ